MFEERATQPGAGAPAARSFARWGGGGMPRPENGDVFLIWDTGSHSVTFEHRIYEDGADDDSANHDLLEE
jgi:hypothetical protein